MRQSKKTKRVFISPYSWLILFTILSSFLQTSMFAKAGETRIEVIIFMLILDVIATIIGIILIVNLNKIYKSKKDGKGSNNRFWDRKKALNNAIPLILNISLKCTLITFFI